MKAKAALLALFLSVSVTAHATTFSTDVSDLWYNSPAESQSGWGVNVIQQDDTLFVTLFVYGANSLPTWFVASNVVFTGTSAGFLNFSGPLYATGGSPFSAPWNPAAFNFRQVGTITFSLATVSTATISYTVDGAQVTKNIVRQTWKNNNLSGSYLGGTVGTYSSCSNPANNGYAEEAAVVTVAHSGASISIVAADSTGSCSYSGTYSQLGRMGTITGGTYSCTGGLIGTFSAIEVEGGLSGLTARVTSQSNFCAWSGRVGGLRRGQ